MRNYEYFIMKGNFLKARFYFPIFLCCKRTIFFLKKNPFELVSQHVSKISRTFYANRRSLFAEAKKESSSIKKLNEKAQVEEKTGEEAEAQVEERTGEEEEAQVEAKKEEGGTINAVENPRKKYKKLLFFYYAILISLYSFFFYCVIKLFVFIFNEPPFLHMIKEKVLNDSQLIEEYEEIKFSKFWTGHVNFDDARVVLNIRSSIKNKKGKIICTLKKVKDEWKIITLTYYDSKRNENLKTDDLKIITNNKSVGSCPIDHNMFRSKNS